MPFVLLLRLYSLPSKSRTDTIIYVCKCRSLFVAPLASVVSNFLSLSSLLLLLSSLSPRAVLDDDWNSSTMFVFPWEDVMTPVRK